MGPRDVVRTAVRAVEGDSVARVAGRWRADLRRDSHDGAALLGLATLARLTYDYAAAEQLYDRVLARGADDHYEVHAQLGRAKGFEARALADSLVRPYQAARAGARALGDSAAEAQALIGLMMQHYYRGNIPAALATLDSAERLIPAARPSCEASCWSSVREFSR
jgi:hypothetical protein